MLLYADDMAVWDYSLPKFETKLKIILEALEDLGMNISEKKSTIQTNEIGRKEYNISNQNNKEEIQISGQKGTYTFEHVTK